MLPTPPSLPQFLFCYSLDFHANNASIVLKETPKGVQLLSLSEFQATAFSLTSGSVCYPLLHPSHTFYSTVILQNTPLGPHNLQTTPFFDIFYKLPPHKNELYKLPPQIENYTNYPRTKYKLYTHNIQTTTAQNACSNSPLRRVPSIVRCKTTQVFTRWAAWRRSVRNVWQCAQFFKPPPKVPETAPVTFSLPLVARARAL